MGRLGDEALRPLPRCFGPCAGSRPHEFDARTRKQTRGITFLSLEASMPDPDASPFSPRGTLICFEANDPSRQRVGTVPLPPGSGGPGPVRAEGPPMPGAQAAGSRTAPRPKLPRRVWPGVTSPIPPLTLVLSRPLRLPRALRVTHARRGLHSPVRAQSEPQATGASGVCLG